MRTVISLLLSVVILKAVELNEKNLMKVLSTNEIKYNCERNDYGCLKNYILKITKDLGYESKFFEEATLENTSLLRQLIHHINFSYKSKNRPELKYHSYMGYMFKQQVGDNCGFMAQTLFDVYKAFGYSAIRHTQVDGVFKKPDFLKYRDSHVFTEVYVPSLKKFIIQDPTFNNIVTICSNKQPLSLQEVKKISLSSNECLDIHGDILHKGFRKNGILSRKDVSSIIDDYYVSIPYSLLKNDKRFLFIDLQIEGHSTFKTLNESKQYISKVIENCKNYDIYNKFQCIKERIKFPFYYIENNSTTLLGFNQSEIPYIIDFNNIDTNKGGGNVCIFI